MLALFKIKIIMKATFNHRNIDSFGKVRLILAEMRIILKELIIASIAVKVIKTLRHLQMMMSKIVIK